YRRVSRARTRYHDRQPQARAGLRLVAFYRVRTRPHPEIAMPLHRFLCIVPLLVAASCATAPAPAQSPRAKPNAATTHFHDLLDSYWQYRMATEPETASAIGYPGY